MNEFNELFENSTEKVIREERLEELDPGFLLDYISEALKTPLENTVDLGYLRTFDEKVKEMKGDGYSTEDEYREDIISAAESTRCSIIDMIGERYGIEFYIDGLPLKKVTNAIYRFFVVDYVQVLSQFITEYMIEHADDIASIVGYDKTNVSTVAANTLNGLPENLIRLMGNLDDVIEYIVENEANDFTLMLEYLRRHPDASPAVEYIQEMNDAIRISSTAAGSIVVSMFAPVTTEEQGFTRVFTNIRQEIFNRFVIDDDE